MTQLIRGEGLTCDLGEQFPPVIPVRQVFEGDEVGDVSAASRAAMDELDLSSLSPGDRVLVTAGSRGIGDVVSVLGEICQYLRGMEVEPIILGAMGSHGGGSPEGQRSVLTSLGITEERIGARIVTSDEAEVIGRDEAGREVYCDPLVLECDGLIAVNRVKPHTTIQGDIQSGLMKILVVGLGHRRGAEAFHRNPPAQLSTALVQMARVLMEKTPFLGGVAIVENARERSAVIAGLRPEEMEEQERRMLVRARELMPSLPFPRADVLVIRRIGKDLSGTCMDTNVIGRFRIDGAPAAGDPEIGAIAALELTDASHGNACGVGLADVITARLASSIDLETTYMNVVTSRLPVRAMVPMIARTDRDAVAACIATSGPPDPAEVRLAIISDTLHLDALWVSPALWSDIRGLSRVSRGGAQVPLEFDREGVLSLH